MVSLYLIGKILFPTCPIASVLSSVFKFVYSIVNSLIELQNINKVQISVEGNNALVFRDTIDMAVLFERNLDIMKSDYGE